VPAESSDNYLEGDDLQPISYEDEASSAPHDEDPGGQPLYTGSTGAATQGGSGGGVGGETQQLDEYVKQQEALLAQANQRYSTEVANWESQTTQETARYQKELAAWAAQPRSYTQSNGEGGVESVPLDPGPEPQPPILPPKPQPPEDIATLTGNIKSVQGATKGTKPAATAVPVATTPSKPQIILNRILGK
jgi:hypothetical protein